METMMMMTTTDVWSEKGLKRSCRGSAGRAVGADAVGAVHDGEGVRAVAANAETAVLAGRARVLDFAGVAARGRASRRRLRAGPRGAPGQCSRSASRRSAGRRVPRGLGRRGPASPGLCPPTRRGTGINRRGKMVGCEALVGPSLCLRAVQGAGAGTSLAGTPCSRVKSAGCGGGKAPLACCLQRAERCCAHSWLLLLAVAAAAAHAA